MNTQLGEIQCIFSRGVLVLVHMFRITSLISSQFPQGLIQRRLKQLNDLG